MAQTIKLKRSATQGASPTTSQLELGEVAINTYDGKMYIKKNVGGTESIVEVGAGGSGGGLTSSFTLYEYTATASQTTFSGSDSNSNTLAYDTGTPPKILVYLNGVLLDHTTDYTATNGTSVVLTSGAAAGDLVQVAAYKSESSVALDIDLADNVKLKLGDDDDLQIYHDGSNSYIDDAGTGGLYVRTGDFRVLKADGSERMIQADDDGAVVLYYDGSSKLQTSNDGVTVTGDVEADEFIGDLRGAVLFKAQAGESLSKGDVVYISGISGNTTIVSKADADDANKMPAFGLAADAASANSSVEVYTSGIISGIDTSSFTVGDEVFTSTTAGALTATAPTGESAALQKIGKVTRSHASSGSIFIIGAGRSNATPNLNEGKLFVGNSSNQAVADDTVHVDIANSRVGINTTSPAKTLDVAANGSSQGIHLNISGVGRLQMYADGDRNYFKGLSGNGHRFTTTGGANVEILNNGKVGIGTSSPSTDALHIVTSGLDDDDDTIVLGANYSSASVLGSIGTHHADVNNGGLKFSSKEAGTLTERLRIAAGGNVGIGTSFPATQLHVSGTANNTYIRIDDGTDFTNIGVDATGSFYNTNTNHRFLTQTGGTEAMRIAANGNVGIGTSSPARTLDVVGDASISTTGSSTGLRITTSTTGEGYLIFGDSTDASMGGISYNNSTNALMFDANNAERMRIDSSGNLLVGTTDATPYNNTSGNAISLGDGLITSAKDGGIAAIFNRMTSGGDVVQFRKDGTAAGSIAVKADTSNNYMIIGKGSVGMQFASDSEADSVLPARPDNQSLRDAGIDLGASGARFKGLYLSGDVALTNSYVFGNTDGLNLRANSGRVISMQIAGSEKARLDSSGRLLVGITSANGVDGVTLNGGGYVYSNRAGGVSGYFDRGTSDGSIVEFRKNGTTAGGIAVATNTSTDISIGSGDINLLFYTNGNAIVPRKAGDGTSNNFADLGNSSNKFKDLYLAGQVNTGTISSGNITTTGYLRGPSTFTIDPAAHGDNTGTVVIAGNLQVDGTTTTINSTTLTVDDKNITLASGSSNKAAANGAGLTVDCGSDTDATFTYDGTNDEWDFNKNVKVSGSVGVTNIVTNKVVKFNGTILDDSNITDTGSLITLGTSTDISGPLQFTSNVSFSSSEAGRIYKASNHGLAFHGVTGTENDFAMFTPAGQLMVVNPTGTNNVALVPTAGGNVGIGNSSPLQKLSVNGIINSDVDNDYYGAWLRGDTSTNGYSYAAIGEWYSAALYIQKKQGQNFTHIYNYNANHPIIIAAGSSTNGETTSARSKVGIGTTSPSVDAGVHIRGSNVGSGETITNTSGLLVENNGSSNSYYVFQTATSGGGKSFSITNAGNVGIGTSSPNYPLHVSGSARLDFTGSDSLYLYRSASSNLNISLGSTNTDFNSAGTINFKPEGSTIQKYQFKSADFIVNGPNVGIGSTAPQAVLDLGNGTNGRGIAWGGSSGTAHYNTIWSEYSSASIIIGAGLKGATDSSTFLNPFTGTYGYAAIELDSFSDDGIKFYTGADSSRTKDAAITPTEHMRLTTGGYLMIGKTNPTFSDSGIELRSGNLGARFTRSNAEPILVNRTGSNGNIVLFYGQGTHIGSIGTGDGNSVYIECPVSTKVGLDFRSDILPRSGGALSNGGVDLGAPSYRFRNIELSAAANIGHASIQTDSTTTSATTQVAIDAFVASEFRSAKYTIQVTNSTDSTYHLTEVLLIHDGTTPGITEYGTVFTGSAAEATFDADISSGNVRLLATPASTDSMTFKVVRHCITV